MILDNFWLDGENAYDRGIRLQREIEFDGPEPDTESESIPGRVSGDIVYWNGAYKNLKGTATCYCLSMDAAASIREINAWLLSKGGVYRRLETLLEPGIYRMARVVRAAQLAPRLNKVNAFTIEFDCQAPKYLKDGEREVVFSAAGMLRNPTGQTAKPLIKLNCSSSSSELHVGGKTLEINTTGNNIVIDCDLQEMYRMQSGSRVNLGYYAEGDFPALGSGENNISFDGGISNVRIVPRWWSI